VLALAGSSAAMAQDGLVVAAFGGPHGETLDACVIKPFMEKTGIPVTIDRGVSTVTLSKLQQQKDNPSLDVVWLDGAVAGLAEENGVVAHIDPAKVPNIANLIDQAIYKNANGEIWALNNGFYSTGIIYNKDKVKEPPASILDLWDDKYAGRVTWPSMADGSGGPMLVYLAEVMGGGLDNIKPGVDKLKQLDVAAYYDSGGNAANLFTRGEVDIGILDSGGVWTLTDSGAFPVGFVIPKEGGVAGDARMLLVKPSDNAYAFLNYGMSAEAAKCIAEKYWYGPAVKNVELSEKARARLPWGENGSVTDLKMPDFGAINKKSAELLDIWNREIVSQ
jgi:putative spermidine/putrescine transport system substrate-binding protein